MAYRFPQNTVATEAATIHDPSVTVVTNSRQPPQVQMRVEHLHKALAELDEMTNQMIEKLGPVLSPLSTGDGPSKADSVREQQAPLAALLGEMAERVRNTTRSLADATERVQL